MLNAMSINAKMIEGIVIYAEAAGVGRLLYKMPHGSSG
jgi:hypothetical protein